jgi:hypothetical protein
MIFVLLLFATPRTGQAYWEKPNEVMFGTAYTLSERTMRIGLFSPMSYGLHDRVTLSTHPILDLLLVPNAGLKVRLVDGTVTASFGAVYNQAFFETEPVEVSGHIRFFGITSVSLGRILIATVTLGLGQDLGVNRQSLHTTLSTHVRLGYTDMIWMEAGFTYELYGANETHAHGMLLYAKRFGETRFGIGVAMGPPLNLEPIGLSADAPPVWPHIDFWRFF